jgi:quercetin dioxygenase-like cupin family protein
MIKSLEYKTREEALEKITKEDRDYIFLKHSFKQGEIVKPHYHPKANEWIIFDSGMCEVSLNSEIKEFKSKGQALAIYFPRRKIHSLICMTDISYWVLRSKKDKIIYV